MESIGWAIFCIIKRWKIDGDRIEKAPTHRSLLIPGFRISMLDKCIQSTDRGRSNDEQVTP